MKAVRVLHFIWSASFGGIEKVVIDLCEEQNRSTNVKAELLVGCRKGSFVSAIEQAAFPHHFAGFRSGLDFRPALYQSLKKRMSQYDVIHLHTFNPLVFSAAAASHKPIVYTIHGNFNFGRKLRMSDRINQSLRKYFFNRKTSFITFNSEFTRQTALSRYGLTKVNSAVLHNGIPLEKIRASLAGIDTSHAQILNHKFVVGTSSRFAGFKRIDRLIRAFGKFAEGKPDVLLLLVGDGVLKTDLERQVQDLNIHSKTLFAGYQQQVSAYQKEMDVCVFPSQGEPFGLVAVETLTLGKPTIAFQDGGGMLEILAKEFPEDIVADENALVSRLEFYYSQRNRPGFGEPERRKAAAARFDISTMAEAMHSVYLNVLKP